MASEDFRYVNQSIFETGNHTFYENQRSEISEVPPLNSAYLTQKNPNPVVDKTAETTLETGGEFASSPPKTGEELASSQLKTGEELFKIVQEDKLSIGSFPGVMCPVIVKDFDNVEIENRKHHSKKCESSNLHSEISVQSSKIHLRTSGKDSKLHSVSSGEDGSDLSLKSAVHCGLHLPLLECNVWKRALSECEFLEREFGKTHSKMGEEDAKPQQIEIANPQHFDVSLGYSKLHSKTSVKSLELQPVTGTEDSPEKDTQNFQNSKSESSSHWEHLDLHSETSVKDSNTNSIICQGNVNRGNLNLNKVCIDNSAQTRVENPQEISVQTTPETSETTSKTISTTSCMGVQTDNFLLIEVNGKVIKVDLNSEGNRKFIKMETKPELEKFKKDRKANIQHPSDWPTDHDYNNPTAFQSAHQQGGFEWGVKNQDCEPNPRTNKYSEYEINSKNIDENPKLKIYVNALPRLCPETVNELIRYCEYFGPLARYYENYKLFAKEHHAFLYFQNENAAQRFLNYQGHALRGKTFFAHQG